MTPAEQVAVQRVHAQLSREIRARLVEFATGTWGSMGSWRDEDVDVFVARLVPVVDGGKRTVAQLTDTYLRTVTGVQAERDAVLTQEALDRLRYGTTPAEVYRRPATEMRTAISNGHTFDKALAMSATRLVSLVSTDLQLAKTHQARRTLSRAEGFDGYRRTLEGNVNCLKCVVASTQLYRIGDLLPIHPGCDCDVAVVRNAAGVVGRNGAIVLEPDLLEAAHTAVENAGLASDRAAREPDYRKLIAERQHGELGPVLTLAEHQFTGPEDIAAVAPDVEIPDAIRLMARDLTDDELRRDAVRSSTERGRRAARDELAARGLTV